MRLTIDTDARTLRVEEDGDDVTMPLYGPEAFDRLSREWLRVGWSQRYSYSFSWMGRPIIQLPEDLVRVQEVVYRLRPDVIIETGVAHGGSLIYYAGLCKAMDAGRVIGIDIEIRPHNRRAIEEHPLASLITLIEGSSTDDATLSHARSLVNVGETVLVLLDSDHSRNHVRAELEAYAPLVSVGSYLVATDGIMRDLADVLPGHPSWRNDNPTTAVRDFLTGHPEFVLEQPAWPFNESTLQRNITYWPDAWLRRVR